MRSAFGSVTTMIRPSVTNTNSGCLTRCFSPLDIIISNGSNGSRWSMSRTLVAFMGLPFSMEEGGAKGIIPQGKGKRFVCGSPVRRPGKHRPSFAYFKFTTCPNGTSSFPSGVMHHRVGTP